MRYRAAFLLAVLALSGCVEEMKESRVKKALINGGLSEQLAGCMAHRMAQKLTIAQLRKLQALAGPKRGVTDYVAALKRVGDADAVEVTLSSAALCKAGFIH